MVYDLFTGQIMQKKRINFRETYNTKCMLK